MKKVVLVTDVKYRMTLPIIRDLGEAGFVVAACARDDESTPLGFASKHTNHTFTLPFNDDQQTYVKKMGQICEQLQKEYDTKPVIFPVAGYTIEAISLFGEELANFADFIVPKPKSLAITQDKRALLAKASQIGLAVPQEYTLLEGETPAAMALRIDYPVVVKFTNSEKVGVPAEKRYAIVKNAADFVATYSKFADLQAGPLVQEYVEGNGVGVSCLFSQNSQPLSFICHRRLREYPISGGPSSCCESFFDPELVKAAFALFKSIGWCGIGMSEFKGPHKGKYYLMEINPRIWGSYPLTRKAKSSFSVSYVLAASGNELKQTALPDYCEGKKMSFVFQDALAGFAHFKRKNFGNFFAWLKDFFNPHVKDAIIEFNDFKASWAYIRSVFKKAGQ